MYSMNKVSSLAHALPASTSSPFCTKRVFCTWVCQQAESRSLQVLSSRAALAAYSQNFLAGHKTHIQQEDVSKPPRLIISQEKKKEDETWLNSQRQELLLVRRTHMGYELFSVQLNCMSNTMKTGGLLRQPSCHPATFLAEPVSLCIIVTPPFVWALYRPQNSVLFHIYFRQSL